MFKNNQEVYESDKNNINKTAIKPFGLNEKTETKTYDTTSDGSGN